MDAYVDAARDGDRTGADRDSFRRHNYIVDGQLARPGCGAFVTVSACCGEPVSSCERRDVPADLGRSPSMSDRVEIGIMVQPFV